MEPNRHHSFFNRAWYRTPILRRLRSHPLMVTEMCVDVHKDLHANIPPPPKPSPDLAVGALCLLNDMKEEGTDQVSAHIELSEYFLSGNTHTARRIGDNLLRQTVYIIDGKVDDENQT